MGSSAAAAVLLCVALSVVVAASAAPEPHIITMAALTATEPSSGRKLIGFPAGFCPVRFDESKQVSKVVSKCKGQETPQASCCKAFSDYACPYYDLLDELTNGCAAEMLMNIHRYCRLPAGYFALCGNSAMGMTCPAA